MIDPKIWGNSKLYWNYFAWIFGENLNGSVLGFVHKPTSQYKYFYLDIFVKCLKKTNISIWCYADQWFQLNNKILGVLINMLYSKDLKVN